MEIEPQEQIRELAYRIWQAEGYPHGYDVQHWLKAEAIWQEEHRSKRKPKRSKPLKRTKSRKTSTTEKELYFPTFFDNRNLYISTLAESNGDVSASCPRKALDCD
jgi:Protein of unknown function (DUF2934)